MCIRDRVVGCRNFDDAVAKLEVLGSCFHAVLHDLVLGVFFVLVVDDDDTLFAEHEGNTSGLTQVAAALVEVMAQVSGSSVLVVGQRFYDDGNTARTVAFIDHIHIGIFIAVACRFFDDAVDVVVWHVVCLCLCNQVAQFRCV